VINRFVGVVVLWLALGSMSLSQSPTVTFKDAKFCEQVVGVKTKYSDAVLMYDEAALVIHADDSSLRNPHILKTIMYADVVGAGYYRYTAPFFSSAKSHWLTVGTGKKVKGLDHYK
jgi:hypothetical protein